MTPRLELQHITKQYPAVRANDDVSLTVMPGEIHAVLGENGAGKSTLMKIIFGAVKPDAGEVRFNGQKVQVRSPQEARALGISMVFQHFSLFDTLTAADLDRVVIGRPFPPQIASTFSARVAGEQGITVLDGVECWLYQHGLRHMGEIELARGLVGLGGMTS